MYEAVLTSTHNLCLGAKIGKICIPMYTSVYYIKVGYEGVYIARICFPDVQKVFGISFHTPIILKLLYIF